MLKSACAGYSRDVLAQALVAAGRERCLCQEWGLTSVSRRIYSGTVCIRLLLSPFFSLLLSGLGRKIHSTALSFSPGELKQKRDVAFLCDLIGEHETLALNSVITGATN